jgi:hypothetical protein
MRLLCQHRWSKELGVVVNLESMGAASGRLHVFQVALQSKNRDDKVCHVFQVGVQIK